MTRDELVQLLMKQPNNTVSTLIYSKYHTPKEILEIPALTDDIKGVRYDAEQDKIVIDVEVIGIFQEETERPEDDNEDETDEEYEDDEAYMDTMASQARGEASSIGNEIENEDK